MILKNFAVVSFYTFDVETTQVFLWSTREQAVKHLEQLWQEGYNAALADENFQPDESWHEEDSAVLKWGTEDNCLRVFHISEVCQPDSVVSEIIIQEKACKRAVDTTITLYWHMHDDSENAELGYAETKFIVMDSYGNYQFYSTLYGTLYLVSSDKQTVTDLYSGKKYSLDTTKAWYTCLN